MTALDLRFPAAGGLPGHASGRTAVDTMLADLATEPEGGPLVVGDQRVRDFLGVFSRRLLRPDLARRFPELGSLGFFLRRGEIAHALERVADASAGGVAVRHVPRGLVLHFPPANVDTIFVYSWALSALAGNRNIVRISRRSAGAAQAVLDALNDVLADAHPAVAATQRMISYERDEAVTAALCVACDLRVMWGGDASVNAIREHPIRPLARDLPFPDRSSFAAISVPGWFAAPAAERAAAVDGLTNDVFWFDQAACSSPRNLFWVGGDEAATAAARTEFATLLAESIARRGWGVDAAMAVEKHVAAYGLAAAGAATSVRFAGNAVANVELAGPDAIQRHWLGAGTVCHLSVGSLEDVVAVVERKDQTFAQFGFSAAELGEFVSRLSGRGVDRIVPFGSALTFAGIWDGYDLMPEFTRITTIQP